MGRNREKALRWAPQLNGELSSSEISKGALWSTINQAVGQFMVLIVFLVTARFVSKDDFGTMAVCLVVFEFIKQITVESIATTMLAKTGSTELDYDVAFTLSNLCSLSASVLMAVIAYPLSIVLDNPDIFYALLIISPAVFIIGSSKIHEVRLIRSMRFKPLALRSLVAIIAGGSTGIALAMNGYGVTSLIIQQLLTSLVSTFMLWRSLPWQPRLIRNIAPLLHFLRYSRQLSATAGIAVINVQSSVFFVSYFLGTAAAGVLNAGTRLISALQLMTTSGLNIVALPALSQVGLDRKILKNGYIASVTYTAALTLPMFTGFGLLSDLVVQIFLGAKWADVAPVISILVIPAFIWSIDQYNSNIFLIRQRPHWRTYLSVSDAFITIALLLIISPLGLIYVAAGIALKSLCFYPVTFSLSAQLLHLTLKELAKPLIPIVGATAIMAAFVLLMKDYLFASSILSLGMSSILGAAIYIFALLVLDKDLLIKLFGFIRSAFAKIT